MAYVHAGQAGEQCGSAGRGTCAAIYGDVGNVFGAPAPHRPGRRMASGSVLADRLGQGCAEPFGQRFPAASRATGPIIRSTPADSRVQFAAFAPALPDCQSVPVTHQITGSILTRNRE